MTLEHRTDHDDFHETSENVGDDKIVAHDPRLGPSVKIESLSPSTSLGQYDPMTGGPSTSPESYTTGTSQQASFIHSQSPDSAALPYT